MDDIEKDPFEEYIKQSEPSGRELGYAWYTAIGLQAVDGLKTSDYLKSTAKDNIEGKISVLEAGKLIESYYEKSEDRNAERTKEADIVSARIAAILSENAFTFSVPQYIGIHRRLFEGIYSYAGRIRDYNISKKEWVLDGASVHYGNALELREMLEYDIRTEKEYQYPLAGVSTMIPHLARFVSGLWQIHAFGEGNTRTTAVFTIQYLRSIGFDINNDLFAKYSWYFRNALVRANYKNARLGIDYSPIYLERFFRNLLLGEQWDLRNRYLHIQASEEWKEQPRLDKPSNTGQLQDKHRTSTEQVPNKLNGVIQTDNPNIEKLIIAIADQYVSVTQMMEYLSLKHRPTFLKNYLSPAIKEQYVRLLYPNSPRHPRQKYLLTTKGRILYDEITGKIR